MAWLPAIDPNDLPLYQQIARKLTLDIQIGRLGLGELLPPHRELAKQLGVNVATITRAYKEVSRLHLITGRARSGTRVMQRQSAVTGWGGPHRDDAGFVDLASNCPPTDRYLLELSATLPQLASRGNFAALQEYPPIAGMPHHCAAAARWIQACGASCTSEQVVLSNGAHQGLAAVLASQTKPGGLIVTEDMTYPPLVPLARTYQLDVTGLAMDGEGILPDSLDAACRRRRPAVLFVTPNHQNPTTATMGATRREAIVAVARRHDLTIIEDDVYKMLLEEDLPPLARLAPERTFYVTSFSKCIAPGLRIGYVRAPDAASASEVAASIGLSTRMATPLMAEIATMWIEDGTAERIIAGQREELSGRNLLGRKHLNGHRIAFRRHGMHLWLELPDGWSALDFQEQAQQRGVAVATSSAFNVGVYRREAARITIGAPRSRDHLEHGLAQLVDVLDRRPPPQPV